MIKVARVSTLGCQLATEQQPIPVDPESVADLVYGVQQVAWHGAALPV
jgi:hypothetical protein